MGATLASLYPGLNKTDLAKKLGVSRASLYYAPKRPDLDEDLKNQIESVMVDHPSYGHKRIALTLKRNKKCVLRVMKKYGLKPARRRVRAPAKPDDLGRPESVHPNLLATLCPIAPNVVWVADFTYLKYRGRFIYLATMVDLFTREVVGWNILRFHSKHLVLGALEHALSRNGRVPPAITHSDRGSEYDSLAYEERTRELAIRISMSDKGSPWQNGHQESFFSHFKLEFGDINRFETLGELVEAIYQHIHYYNEERIHTALKMPPAAFKEQYCTKLTNQPT